MVHVALGDVALGVRDGLGGALFISLRIAGRVHYLYTSSRLSITLSAEGERIALYHTSGGPQEAT